MSSRDYYKVSYSTKDSDRSNMRLDNVLDNDTEFNANQFKLYDDFTTDLRINFNPIRNNFQDLSRKEVRRRTGDPNDSGVDMENGNPLDDVATSKDSDLLENEVMVDPWSSMDSSNSPLTDSGPSASEDCTPSTSSEPPHGPLDAQSPLSPLARRLPNPKDAKPLTTKTTLPKTKDKARSRDLTLDLETLEPDRLPRRPHFLDEDYQPPSKSNIECRIPKPHFLDHSPSPDEFDERSDITNPHFLDDEVDGDDNIAQKKAGALPKRQVKPQTSTYSSSEDRPHRTNYRTALHYGLESAARSSERDKRASQLYRGTWPGERDWTGHDSSSVRSFSSNGSSDCPRPSSNLDNKMDCVFSLISLLSLSPENNADLSAPLLEMSRSVESCIAMRQAGCIPLLVQLIHSKVPRDIRDRAAKALRNIIHTQTDDKAGRREARVWRLLEQVREYCYVLEDVVEARKDGKEIIEDDATKHPSQSVAALMKLSFDEEHRHVVCQLGGLQALAALVSGDQAAHGSRTDDNTCLTMRKYAGMTLTNLTFGDGNNKSLLCSFKDFMLALVEQLESPNDDMRQVTAAVLRNLSWRADTNSKQVLREVGAVKGLTKAAMTCQKEATLKSVLSALWNLTAHCTMNKVALCSVDGALGFLVDMLSYNSPTKTLAIVENAGGIMRNVSSQIAVREEYRQILRERNCLSVLLQHLKSPSLTVVSNSCGTLWNLSARCPLDQEFLWDHGAVPMLRSLIHSKHKMIAMGSSAALKNLLNSKPGKTHIISLDTTARSMNLPALPTLGARKQKALEQELDQNLAETCDNIEPATSPSTSNREEKNLFTATERQIAMNLERHRMTASSPLMGTLTSQISLSHSAHLASYLSCSNTLLKGAMVTRSNTSSSGNVNRSDSKDSVTSTHSDSVFERVMRTGKVPVPTPRSKDLMKAETGGEAFKVPSKQTGKDGFMSYPTQPPIPPPRSSTDVRSNYTESGYDVDQDSCDQPIDYSQKYSETKAADGDTHDKNKTSEGTKKDDQSTYGDYQETDLDQPTDYSLRYAEHQSETGSDSEPPGPSDTIKHFATEGTPYETPIIFSTATSMSDLRVIGKDMKQKTPSVKENPEIMTHSDEKDTCSIEDPPRHDNDLAATTPQGSSPPEPEPKRAIFDTKFSSGMISPEKPVNYCDEGTPGYFSRVSSLSSVGEPTEEDCLAKKNAMATINVEPGPEEPVSSSIKDKEGCKAVTFARPPAGQPPGASPPAPEPEPQETPLMFSRSSSLGSLPDCEHDSQGSVLSEFSRLPSGLLSPSEIPDSPGMSMPQSPRPPAPAPRSPPESGQQSVFSERVRCFVVEHTPALLSGATSLSSLTIDDEPKARLVGKLPPDLPSLASARNQSQLQLEKDEMREHVSQLPPSSSTPNAPYKGTQTPSDICRVYFTEDTPAILSKAGSNSNLSALSIDSAPPELAEVQPEEPQQQTVDSSDSSNLSDANDVLEECIQKGIAKVSSRRRRPLADADTSDSSNLSDAGDLLEECIQKGIDKVVKNKGPPSEVSSVPYTARSDVYRSLPPYLRSSTETVKMSHEFARNARDSRSVSSERAPPLPPKLSAAAAPPPPPRHHAHRPRETRASRDADSTSSLSLDSFGSTDREIFEETVKAGLPHRARSPGSNSNDSFGSTDKEVFERCVRAGISKTRRPRSLDRRSRPRPDRRSSADPTPLGPRRAPPDPPAPRRVPPDPPAPRRAPEPPKNGPAPSAHRAPAGDAAPERACTGYKEHSPEGTKDTPPRGTEQDKRQLEQLKESTMSLEGTQARSEYKRLFGDAAPKRACTGSKHLSEAPKDTPPPGTEQDKRQLEEARSEYKRLLDDAALARACTGSKHLSEAPKDTPPRETDQDKRQLEEGTSLVDTQARSEYKRILDDACTGSKQHLSEAPDDTPHHETEQDKRQLEGTSLDDTQTRSEYKRLLDDAAPKRACTGSKQHSSEAPDDTPPRETEQDKRQLEEGTSLEDTQVQDKRLLEEGSNVNLQPLVREKDHRYTEPEDKTLLREDSKSLNVNSEGKETQSFSEHLKMLNEQSRVLSEEDNTQLDINTDNITKNTNDYQQPTDAHYTLHEHVRSTDGNSSEYQQPPEIHYEEDNLETRLDRREQINALDRPEEDLNSSNDVECELASLNRTKDAIDLDRSNESYADVTDEEEDERQVYSAASTLRDLHRSNEAYADIDDNEAGTKHNDRIDGNVNSTKLERANVNSASYYASDDDQNHRHDGNVNSSKLANVNSASYYASDDEQNDRLVGNVNSAKLERANVNSASYYASDDDTSRAHSVASTLNNRVEYEWVDIKQDTWEEHTCPDDVTFPTISSVHLDASVELPDLLEKRASTASTRPDLTNRLEGHRHHDEQSLALDESETNLDSLMAAAIEKEAARLAAQLKNSQFAMEASVTSLTSLDLDNVRPPSNLGSLLSLSASGHWDDSAQVSKKSKSRKKSLPVAFMVKRALSNSMHRDSSEHLDSIPVSFLDNVKPPSELEAMDMEGSMVSVASIVSEVAEGKERVPVVFDLKQPIQDFPLCSAFTSVFHDLDKVNPPSLFDEMAESTFEIDQTTAQQVFDDCVSNTLNVVTDIPSGSETCTPLPSDVSSVESTPKRHKSNYLTPKEKRHVSKDRYQTYTITDTMTENDIVEMEDEEFLTWTKSEEYVTATSESKSKRKISAKQRRLEDRARYQTQTVDIHNIITHESSQFKVVDPHIESLKQRLNAKKTMKQKRLEDAERFRTRTLSEDIPPSPTFVTKDANFENVETTTGYDSLSSNELNHQQLLDDRPREDDVFRDGDSGHNEDDFELNSTQMQTYTKSFRNYLPVIESPAAVDMCVVNNLKNIEMTASFKRTMQEQSDKNQHPSSGDFASYEGDSNSEDRGTESDQDSRPKPKIVKPARREESLDSNESLDKEQGSPKAIRGRKKALYVSPYRRTTAPPKKPTATANSTKPTPKTIPTPKTVANTKPGAKIPSKTPTTSKPPSANTSPKKSIPHRSPTKVAQKPVSIPIAGAKPLPLERQGTFTKEESSVPAKDLPIPDKKSCVPQYKATSPTKPVANTSPSRLPQLNRFTRPAPPKGNQKPTPKTTKRPVETAMKNSPSNHSLQSNDSGKTVTLASRSSRQGSTSSVNSVQSSKTKDVESKIANLWKKVEQSKKQPTKPDKRVWIESDKTEPPKLIRSSTFEGQPKPQVSSAQKQKSAIGIRVSQIPSLRPKSTSSKAQTSTAKKPTARVFARKPISGQVNS